MHVDNLLTSLELDNDIKEIFKNKYKEKLEKYIKYIEDNINNKFHKKNFKSNINELSYNRNKMIIETWDKLNNVFNIDNDSESIITLESENNENNDLDSD